MQKMWTACSLLKKWNSSSRECFKEANCLSDVVGAQLVRLFPTPWTAACQVSLTMGFYKQENLGSSLGDLPNPGIEPGSPALEADSLMPEPPGKPTLMPEPPGKPTGMSGKTEAEIKRHTMLMIWKFNMLKMSVLSNQNSSLLKSLLWR